MEVETLKKLLAVIDDTQKFRLSARRRRNVRELVVASIEVAEGRAKFVPLT